MAKITRKVAKVFGANAGTNQIAQFGSLAASAPAFSTDPATIQSLSNWLVGWFAGVEGAASPAIEDLNAFCYVMAYQIAYQMQTGIPEWNSSTTYYIGSVVNDGTGSLYVSIVDNNLNNTLVTTADWLPLIKLTDSGFNISLVAPTLSANRIITLPGITSTLSTLAGIETLTNKTLTTPVITGITNGGVAISGQVGQQLSATNNSGSSMTNNTVNNVTSQSVPNGVWLTSGTIAFSAGTNPTGTELIVGIDPTNSGFGQTADGSRTSIPTMPTTVCDIILPIGPYIINVSAGPTTFFLNALALFSAGSITVKGGLRFLRVL